MTPVYVSMLSKAHMMMVKGAQSRITRRAAAPKSVQASGAPRTIAGARRTNATTTSRTRIPPASRMGPLFQTKEAPNPATSAERTARKANAIPKSGPSAAAIRKDLRADGAARGSRERRGPARGGTIAPLASGLLDGGDGDAMVAWVGIGTTVKGLSRSASVNRPQGEKVRHLPRRPRIP